MAAGAGAQRATMAWPLALIYAALVLFASLFPFEGWRAQGISPWEFLAARMPPPYWTWFDVSINVVGYVPLGFLLALALLRSGWPRAAVPLAALAGALLSLAMEFLQIYLPQRVSSNLDLVLNAGGTLCGALAAALSPLFPGLAAPHAPAALAARWPFDLPLAEIGRAHV